MQRRLAILLAALAGGAAGCGSGGRTSTAVRTVTAPAAPAAMAQGPDEVLAVGALGRLTGRCPRGSARWALRYTAAPGTATETIVVRAAGAPPRRRTVQPGGSAALDLPAADARLSLEVTQATEAQTLHAKLTGRLLAAAGESGRCVFGALSLRAS